jgi:hypothetical protein
MQEFYLVPENAAIPIAQQGWEEEIGLAALMRETEELMPFLKKPANDSRH